jgi:hypothetical protein
MSQSYVIISQRALSRINLSARSRREDKVYIDRRGIDIPLLSFTTFTLLFIQSFYLFKVNWIDSSAHLHLLLYLLLSISISTFLT